ncbi:hypothetical protein DBR37_03275 [Herminiimonas sp. KBW02]|uniref:hypothetical protein n=1 Tax=Herminiimonas sp. KBW02 TaxID=2153363 RepID=UPI000F59247F|nr:hypothetical protein [Herminiimonas sp. KBW02]RQO37224.1 hypothetical protein DBR37_03275 [Herminiimonas sp. KBW02]
MSITWWEKTVEYKFVVSVMAMERMFLSPLDGTHEQAGDAIFSKNEKWILIEFKKDQISINSEKAKFINYTNARQALSNSDGHHLIVFGSKGDKTRPSILLNYQTYFSSTKKNDVNEVLASGIEFKSFKHYVESFAKFKKASNGGGGLSMNDFSLVAGINSDGSISQYLSLSEFQRQLNMELLHEKELNRDRGYER